MLLAILSLTFVIACGGDDEEEAEPTAAPVATAKPAPTTAPVATPTPKSEPIVTPPTATPRPAGAPSPTPAPTATPAPTIFDESRYGGVIRWVPQGSVGNMDSMSSGSAVGRGVSWHFWEVLAVWDSSGVLNPDMLESWESDGKGKTTFVFRDGLKWHDGGVPGPADVEATWERFKEADSNFAPTIKKWWVGFDTIDSKTFTITLDRETGLLMTALGYVGGVQPNIMPKATAEKFAPGEFVTDFNASGPYKFVSWDVGNEIILDRFEDYVPRTEEPDYRAGAKLAYADRLHMIEIPDQQTRMAAVLTDSVDYLDVISGDFYEETVKNADKVSIHVGRPGAQPDIMFNMYDPMIGTPAGESGRLIRKAIQMAVNAEDIMKGYGDPTMWQLCNSMWFCDTVWGQAGVNDELYNPNDVAAAKAFLAQSDYDGEAILILDPTDFPTIHPIAPVLEQQLEAIGMNAEILATDWASQISALNSGTGWQIFTNWNSSNLYHPLTTQPLNVSDAGDGRQKRATHYYSGSALGQALNALKLEFAVAKTLDEQLALAREMSDIWWDNPKSVNFGNFLQLRVLNADLKGIEARGAPVGSPILLNLWWENETKRAQDPR